MPPFERGEALLDDGLRRVLDAGVDVAELGQGEEVLRVLGVVEDVGGGLVDRRGARVGDGVGCCSGVDLLRLECPVGLVVAHRVSPSRPVVHPPLVASLGAVPDRRATAPDTRGNRMRGIRSGSRRARRSDGRRQVQGLGRAPAPAESPRRNSHVTRGSTSGRNTRRMNRCESSRAIARQSRIMPGSTHHGCGPSSTPRLPQRVQQERVQQVDVHGRSAEGGEPGGLPRQQHQEGDGQHHREEHEAETDAAGPPLRRSRWPGTARRRAGSGAPSGRASGSMNTTTVTARARNRASGAGAPPPDRRVAGARSQRPVIWRWRSAQPKTKNGSSPMVRDSASVASMAAK